MLKGGDEINIKQLLIRHSTITKDRYFLICGREPDDSSHGWYFELFLTCGKCDLCLPLEEAAEVGGELGTYD